MSCPSCGHNGMLFEKINGMEHNVCESCGTVIEIASFKVDVFQKGCRDVPSDYDAKPGPYRYGRNPKSKAYGEGKDLMAGLMDRLQLSTSVKETALCFFQHSRYLDRLGSIGASIYLAMKYNNIPITIRYLSNYLQVSHFTIGRMMKKLEKRIGYRGQCSAFSIEMLIPLIFNQAQFGGEEGGKKRLELMLDKTGELVKLLQECLVTTGCEPHLMILAAGYIVWRHLISHNWHEIVENDGAYRRSKWTVRQISAFLAEMRITLSATRVVHNKVNIIIGLLYKLSLQIPWISARNPSKDIIFYNLDDFINHKSQIIELTAQELSNESSQSKKTEVEVKQEDFCGDEHLHKESSLSMVTELEVKSDFNHEGVCDAASNANSGKRDGNTSETVYQIDLSEVVVDPNVLSKQNESVFRTVKYTKVTDIVKASFRNEENNIDIDGKSDANDTSAMLCDESVEQSNNLNSRNGFNQLVKFTHPDIGRIRNRNLACKIMYNQGLSFP